MASGFSSALDPAGSAAPPWSVVKHRVMNLRRGSGCVSNRDRARLFGPFTLARLARTSRNDPERVRLATAGGVAWHRALHQPRRAGTRLRSLPPVIEITPHGG